MLQGISWGTYLESAAILTAIYYTGVATIFYRGEIKALATAKAGSSEKADRSEAGATDHTAAFDNLESLVHEIDSILEQAGIQAAKDQLLPQLKAKLASYGGLRQPAYQAAVFNHIINQAKEICGIRISEEELAG
jgi:predicted dinucleotide-utilizing enzyme